MSKNYNSFPEIERFVNGDCLAQKITAGEAAELLGIDANKLSRWRRGINKPPHPFKLLLGAMLDKLGVVELRRTLSDRKENYP